MTINPDQLAALAAAVDHGTFDAAAGHLHVTPSAVSQRIRALETAVGRVLVTRSKPVQATEAGTGLLRLARQVAALTDEALGALAVDAGRSAIVPVTVNADSLATWFPAALGLLGDSVLLDIYRADQSRTAGLLRSGEAMAAVTTESVPVAGCTVSRLGRMTYRAVAAPGFAAHWFSDGPTGEALSRAPIVVYDRTDDLQDRYLRRRSKRLPTAPRHHVPDSHVFVQAIAAGLGWGMVPDLQRGDADLVEIDPPRGTVHLTLYWQQWRLRSSALDTVSAAVHRAAAALR